VRKNPACTADSAVLFTREQCSPSTCRGSWCPNPFSSGYSWWSCHFLKQSPFPATFTQKSEHEVGRRDESLRSSSNLLLKMTLANVGLARMESWSDHQANLRMNYGNRSTLVKYVSSYCSLSSNFACYVATLYISIYWSLNSAVPGTIPLSHQNRSRLP
jgi:hypothetical protein